LIFHQPDSSDLLKKLESGEVDLAIGPFPGLIPGIRRRRLFPATYKVLAVPDHPFIRDPTLQRYRASDHVMVTLTDKRHAHSAVVRQIEDSVPPERIVLRVAGFVTAGFVAKRAKVLATVPTFQAVVTAEELGLEVVVAEGAGIAFGEGPQAGLELDGVEAPERGDEPDLAEVAPDHRPGQRPVDRLVGGAEGAGVVVGDLLGVQGIADVVDPQAGHDLGTGQDRRVVEPVGRAVVVVVLEQARRQ